MTGLGESFFISLCKVLASATEETGPSLFHLSTTDTYNNRKLPDLAHD